MTTKYSDRFSEATKEFQERMPLSVKPAKKLILKMKQ